MNNKIEFPSQKEMLEFLNILKYWNVHLPNKEKNTLIFESEEKKDDAIDLACDFHWCEGCDTGGNASLYIDGCYYCEKCWEEQER